MLLWLPLFGGSALAASISMQMGNGGCHEAAPAHTMPMHHHMGMHMNMSDHHNHADAPAPTDKHCDTCEVCHLVATGYLTMPGVALLPAPADTRDVTPYLVSFDSFVSAPLVPPPLVRA